MRQLAVVRDGLKYRGRSADNEYRALNESGFET